MKFLSNICFGIAALCAVVLIMYCCGCAPHTPPPLVNGVPINTNPVAPIVNHLIATSHPVAASVVQSTPAIIRAATSAPPDLKPVSKWTNVLTIIGILIAAAGVGVYFLSATLHKIAVSLIAGALALTGLSLFVHTTLWIIPWVSGALVLSAVVLIAYEFFRNRASLDNAVSAEINKSTGATTVLFPDLAKHVKTIPLVRTNVSTGTPTTAVVQPNIVNTVVADAQAAVKDIEAKL